MQAFDTISPPLCQIYHIFLKKRLDKSLTGVYTVYVDSERKDMTTKFDEFEAKWAKYIATVEKKTAKKKTRFALKLELKKLLVEEGA